MKLLSKLLPISLLVLIVGLLAWRAMPNSPITKLAVNPNATLVAQLETIPEWPMAGGPTALAVTIQNTDGSTAQLMNHHARRVHSLIVSDDFSVFGHIHPEDFSGQSFSDQATPGQSDSTQSSSDQLGSNQPGGDQLGSNQKDDNQSTLHAGMNHSMPMATSMPMASDTTDDEVSQHALRFRFPQTGHYLMGIDVMSAEASLSQIWRLKVGSDKAASPRESQPLRNEAVRQRTPNGYSNSESSPARCFIGYPETGTDRYVEPVIFSEAEVSCENTTAYRVTLANKPELIRAEESFKLFFEISKNGQAVTDLQPYLAAALHLAIVPESFDNVFHHHGVPGNDESRVEDKNFDETTAISMSANQSIKAPTASRSDSNQNLSMAHMHAGHGQPLPNNFGPQLTSEPLQLAAEGNYWVFAQFKHDNHIVFTRFPLKVEPSFADSEAKTVSFALKNQQLLPASASIQQGDNVILKISSDVAGDFHLTGYELEQTLQTNRTVEMRFTATHSGMFGIELHPANSPDQDIPLGSLQVQPK